MQFQSSAIIAQAVVPMSQFAFRAVAERNATTARGDLSRPLKSINESAECCPAMPGCYPGDTSDLSVAEGILAYVKHLGKFGPQQSSAVITSKSALKAVRRIYGREDLANFGPVALQASQQAWVEEGITRGGVNRRTSFVKRWAKWLVSQELVGPEFYQRLITVEGLRLGRTTAPDNPPTKPADPTDLQKAILHLCRR